MVVTGPSGCGKSLISRTVIDRMGKNLKIAWHRIEPSLPIIQTWPVSMPEAVRRLSLFGLADPFTWARSFDQLSTGQQARFTACADAHAQGDVIVIDEWCNALDELTAAAVAWSTSRALTEMNKRTVYITSREACLTDTAWDCNLRLGWSGEVDVWWNPATPSRSTAHDLCYYTPGTGRDWKRLKPLHYIAGNPATVRSYHAIRHTKTDATLAVAILSFPAMACSARNLASDRRYTRSHSPEIAALLNREVAVLSRIVVTPELRGIGLASRLIREVMLREDVRYIECSTMQGEFTGWLTGCGFRPVPQMTGKAEGQLYDWGASVLLQPADTLDAEHLREAIGRQSVRRCRAGYGAVWNYYHHYILHRRTKAPPPGRTPNPTDGRWTEALTFAATRLRGRPSYWIVGPLNEEQNA